MTIHKEGRTLLFWLLAILAGINFGTHYLFPEQETVLNLILLSSIIFYLLILQFFRNPTILMPDNETIIYAPAEGKVVVIEEAEETEFLHEKRRQISIFMSPVNVHINRSPISGIVDYFKYHPGKYMVAWHPKASYENERTTMVVRNTKTDVKILVRQIAGAVARRIRFYVKEGDPIVQGGEFGFIKFGSRVDVFVPLDAEILVNIDDKTKGGITPLARLKQ
ncbi:phosphatidylserine decarboxylase [Echinicola pacifica]|uniref:Phosphatidylserine decarboxylase proenzyme n=1 Tax=Echinicola pacifica TaxID=346377 RepID=A0A918UV78_9BACT|nr:phosphatidylserine decarboxylase family protein [Echinicola pacifica]GGZ35164.1 phosphatidylserine decarboxylase [Echinicola pacifica]